METCAGGYAICPYFGIEAVLPDAAGLPIDREFLLATRPWWLGHGVCKAYVFAYFVGKAYLLTYLRSLDDARRSFRCACSQRRLVLKMRSFVDISDADYEQRRHASELAAWVNAKFREIEAGGRLEEQYFEQKGRNVKRFLEEALPLSRLGLYYWRPGDEPYIELVAKKRRYDGRLEVEGFARRSMKVEVTTVESDASTMRRQALSREGTVYLTGPIRREKRTIISKPEMVNVREKIEATVEAAFNRFKAKAESDNYDANTAILVYLSEYWPLPAEGRLALRVRVRRYLESAACPTSTAYFCYWPEYSIEGVEVRRQGT